MLLYHLPKAAQVLLGQLALWGLFAFVGSEGLWQFTRSQFAAGVFDDFLHIEGFGPLVQLIEILGNPFETGGVSQTLPTASFVGSAAKELGINKTFHQHNGMAVGPLPIGRQTGHIEA